MSELYFDDQIQTCSVVLVGENLPLRQLRVEDLALGDAPLETMRLPIVLEIQGAMVRFTGTPERYQFLLQRDHFGDAGVDALRSAAESVLEVAGKRSVAQVGINYECRLSNCDISALRTQLLNNSILSSFDVDDAPWSVKRQCRGADTPNLAVTVTAEGRPPYVKVDLNFHYDLGLNPVVSTVPQALARIPASIEVANALVGALASPESVNS